MSCWETTDLSMFPTAGVVEIMFNVVLLSLSRLPNVGSNVFLGDCRSFYVPDSRSTRDHETDFATLALLNVILLRYEPSPNV